jgi:hypothetical protein
VRDSSTDPAPHPAQKDETFWEQVRDDTTWNHLTLVFVTIGLPLTVGVYVSHLLRRTPRLVHLAAGWIAGIVVAALIVAVALAVRVMVDR